MIPPRKQQMNKGPMPGPGPASRRRLLLRGFTFSMLSAEFFVRYQALPWLAARKAGKRLAHVSGPPIAADRVGVALVTCFYGDAPMLRSFIDHHRGIGVREFVFLDLSSEAALAALLAEEDGCAIWRPQREWEPSQVPDFLNFLRSRYAMGRWCLSLEVTDRFVFYRCESRQIRDFIDFLESESRRQAYALVVDMYGDGAAAALGAERLDPTVQLPFFDAFGYTTAIQQDSFRSVIVRGGVQRRALNAPDPSRSPPINRIPLVKWERFCGYVSNTRLLAPRHLNVPHSPWHSSATAVLLRYALLQPDDQLALAVQVEARTLEPDGAPGAQGALAGVPKLKPLSLKIESSARYKSTKDLVEFGLLNPGQWF